MERRRLIIVAGALLLVATVVAAAAIAARDRWSASPPAATSGATTSTAARAGRAGAGGIGDPYFPETGNGGYDVDHYALDLTWDPTHQHLDGVTTIDAVATQALSSFSLDLIGLRVTAVDVDDNPARWERPDDHELVVTPAHALAVGARFTAVVHYDGTPAPIAGPPPLEPGFMTDGREVYVASEPDGAATFFPANDHPTDKATYEIRVTVPEDLDVAANGLRRETIARGGGIETWVFDAADPMATYLVQVVIGNLRFETQAGPAGLPIRNAYDADLPDRVGAAFARQGEMIDFFDDRFGPFPFGTYGAVVVDEDLGFALETQTLSLFGGDDVAEPVIAHELAHQWFGDHVSVGSWRDIWLNEGFATYAQWLWSEHRGDGTVDDMAQGFADTAGLDLPPADPGADQLFQATVYVRGALTLHVLRHELGDELFFELLRTWVDRYGGASATTADFEALAEAVGRRDLSQLFDAWLRAPSMPTLAEWL
ncbi:MAG TPA: M1 family metallopeptidase [Acidimicrobiales bacterium]|nr:M1 family metallopeptidase [Acidimicrobiales bacterium]